MVDTPELICYRPTRGFVPIEWADGFRALRVPRKTRFYTGNHGVIDSCRNDACQIMLDTKADKLLFLDDDTIPPADGYERLEKCLANGADIASGLYWRRRPPLLIVPQKMQDNNTPGLLSELPKDSVLMLDRAGCGFLLIARKVIETLKWPWFKYTQDNRDLPVEDRKSEDFYFCDNARKAGLTLVVDTGCVCQHCGMGFVDDGIFRPL